MAVKKQKMIGFWCFLIINFFAYMSVRRSGSGFYKTSIVRSSCAMRLVRRAGHSQGGWVNQDCHVA